MGAHGWVAGIASHMHGSMLLSRGWVVMVTVEFLGLPRQPSSTQLDALINYNNYSERCATSCRPNVNKVEFRIQIKSLITGCITLTSFYGNGSSFLLKLSSYQHDVKPLQNLPDQPMTAEE